MAKQRYDPTDSPFVGTYEVKRNAKHQTVFPSELEEIVLERQGQEDLWDCMLYMGSRGNKVILKECLTEKECASYKRVSFDTSGRFVIRFGNDRRAQCKLLFKGKGEQIEVTKKYSR